MKVAPKPEVVCETTAYAELVVGNKITACANVIGACRRFLDDLEHGHKRDLYFDVEEAQWVMSFLREVCCLSDGDYDGEPFNLFGWQCFVVGNMYGWKRQSTDKRRFRKAYIETGKGSGKTPLFAGLAIFSICGDDEMKAQSYIAGRTSDQAGITFNDAAHMIEASPELRDRLVVYGGKVNPWNIYHDASRSFLRKLTTEKQGKGKSGQRTHFALIEEYHEHETDGMLDFLDAGQKSRSQPMTAITTNAGALLESPCGAEHNYAISVATGKIKNDTYFAFVCGLDEADDPWTDRKCWVKANPSLPDIPGIPYIEAQMEKARGMPSKRALVDRLCFCRWGGAVDQWISMERWRACETKKLSKERMKHKAFISMDLSERKDLTAASIVHDLNGSYEAEAKIWMPEEAIEDKRDSDGVPYDLWVEQGYIEATPGSIVNYSHIVAWVVDMYEAYDVVGIAYDPWRIQLLIEAFEKEDADIKLKRINKSFSQDNVIFVVPHPQGFVAGQKAAEKKEGLWMPQSLDEFEHSILEDRFKVLYNPCLRACVLNSTVVADGSNNRRFVKGKTNMSIDACVAVTMGVGFAASEVRPKISPLQAMRKSMGVG